MEMKLIRLEEAEDGTFGVLLVDGRLFCCTLEPADRDNQRNISNIPPDTYECERTISPRFGKTFKVLSVPNRSHILFHAGNVARHTQGCILLGSHWGKLRGQRAILNSGKTFRELLEITQFITSFNLMIIDPR